MITTILLWMFNATDAGELRARFDTFIRFESAWKDRKKVLKAEHDRVIAEQAKQTLAFRQAVRALLRPASPKKTDGARRFTSAA